MCKNESNDEHNDDGQRQLAGSIASFVLLWCGRRLNNPTCPPRRLRLGTSDALNARGLNAAHPEPPESRSGGDFAPLPCIGVSGYARARM